MDITKYLDLNKDGQLTIADAQAAAALAYAETQKHGVVWTVATTIATFILGVVVGRYL